MRSNEYIVIFSVLLLSLVFHIQCNKRATYLTVQTKAELEQVAVRETKQKDVRSCVDPLDYAPYDTLLRPLRRIRINVHFMDSKSGKDNFGEKKGRSYMKQLIANANDRLTRNAKMKIPVDNDTPNLSPQYQYVVTPTGPNDDGFFFHKDDELSYFLNKGKDKNNYNRDVIKKYAISDDTILNIFVMPHHPDSVKTGRYKPVSTGIALGTSLKLAGLVEQPEKPWNFATLLNHEVGHIFGLRHSWYKNDGCDDTPVHKNCWQPDGTEKCPEPGSNNMMDYNNSQMAITPCQLGKIHKNFSSVNSDLRQLVIPSWCDFDGSKTIVVNDQTQWRGSLDLSHNVVIKKGGVLTIKCRLSMARNSSITVEPGGKLILDHCRIHNDCGDTWNGIQVASNKKESGELIYMGEVTIENTSKKKMG